MAKIVNLLNKGKKKLQENIPDKAINLFNKCLDLDPNFAEAWANLAQAYNQLEKYDEAIKACDKALELEPDLKIAMNNLFYAYDQKEEFDNAMNIFGKYINLYLDNNKKRSSFLEDSTFKNAGVIIIPLSTDHINGNDIKELFAAISYKNPSEYIEINYQNSLLFSKIYKSDKRINGLKLILEKDPKKIDTWIMLGTTYFENEDVNNAKPAFSKALELDGSNFLALVGLAQCYSFLGDYKNAEKLYENALEISSEIDPLVKYSSQIDIAWNNLGFCYLKLNKYDKAIEALKNALEININLKTSWTHLGEVYYEISEYEEALNCIKKALTLDPNFKKAMNLKNEILKKER